MPRRPLITACVLAAVAFALYSHQLTSSSLTADERVFAGQAHDALSSHPLLFHVADDRWLQSVAVYAAAIGRALGGGDYSGRFASALVGAFDVALLFGAVQIVTPYRTALAAAVILMATPAHFWFARLGTDAIFPVPFILAWLMAALRFVHFDSRRALLVCGLALGAGVYTHPTAPLVMGALAGATILAAIVGRRSIVAAVVNVAGAFALMLAPLGAWFWMHPVTYADTYGRWAIFAAHIRFPLDGLRAQLNWNTLSNRTTIFWGLLDPSFLFFPLTAKTIAPLLLLTAVLAPLGIARVAGTVVPAERAIALAVAIIPPLVACTFGQPQDLSLLVAMSASAALLSAYGLSALAHVRAWWTWIAVVAILASAYQLIAM